MKRAYTCYCENCIDYLKTCGYKLFVGDRIDDDEIEENNLSCDFCDESEDIELFNVIEN